MDVSVKECLQDDACRTYRYVDDYLVFLRGEEPTLELHDISNVFEKCGMGVAFTSKQAVEGCIRFLDVKLDVSISTRVGVITPVRRRLCLITHLAIQR